MKEIDWSVEKDAWLRSVRGLSFQMVEEAIELHEIIADDKHPNPEREHQRILVFRLHGRCVAVSYVETVNGYFLKTMYCSRNFDAEYGGQND